MLRPAAYNAVCEAMEAMEAKEAMAASAWAGFIVGRIKQFTTASIPTSHTAVSPPYPFSRHPFVAL